MNRQNVVSKLFSRIFRVVVLFIIIFSSSFHLFIIITTSLKSITEVYSLPVTWIPHELKISNYTEIFTYFPLLTYFKNSLLIAIGTIAGTLIIGIPAAYALSHLKIKWSGIISMIILATQMFSPIIIIFPLYKIMLKLGLIGSLWSVIIGGILFALAFVVLLLVGFFNTIPKELVESAYLDGAGRLDVLFKILIPLATSGIVVTVMYIFILSWNDFVFAFMFNNTPDKYTVIVGIYDLVSQTMKGIARWDYIMTAAFYSSIPVLVLFIFMSKKLTSGLTAGALKG